MKSVNLTARNMLTQEACSVSSQPKSIQFDLHLVARE